MKVYLGYCAARYFIHILLLTAVIAYINNSSPCLTNETRHDMFGVYDGKYIYK